MLSRYLLPQGRPRTVRGPPGPYRLLLPSCLQCDVPGVFVVFRTARALRQLGIVFHEAARGKNLGDPRLVGAHGKSGPDTG